MKTLCTLCLLALAAICNSQTMSLDSSFGNNGLATIPNARFYPLLTYSQCMALQPDGKVIAGGGAVLSTSQIALVRYNTDGTPDNSFGYQGAALNSLIYNSQPVDITLQSDGKILVYGGNQTTPTDTNFFYNLMVSRHLTNGNVDSSFGTNGFTLFQFADTSMDIPSAMGVQSTGKIVCLGLAQEISGQQISATYQVVMRLNANGSIDSTFGIEGKVKIPLDYVGIMAIQPDDKIVIASDSFPGFQITRLLPNGQFDSTFGGDGMVNQNYQEKLDKTYALAIQPDGKIVVGGKSTTYISRTAFALARFNANGSLDNTFGTDGKVIAYTDTTTLTTHHDELRRLHILPDGKILAAGKAFHRPGLSDGVGMIRFNGDGSRDFTFNNGGALTSTLSGSGDYPAGLNVQSDGKILVLNHAYFAAQDLNFPLARFEPLVSTAINAISAGIIQALVFPNPLSENSTLQLNLQQPEVLTANIFDVQGKLVQRLFENRLFTAGTSLANINGGNLLKGNYLLVVSGKNYTSSIKITR